MPDEAGWKLTAWDASAPESVDGFRTAGASALVDGAMVGLGGEAGDECRGGRCGDKARLASAVNLTRCDLSAASEHSWVRLVTAASIPSIVWAAQASFDSRFDALLPPAPHRWIRCSLAALAIGLNSELAQGVRRVYDRAPAKKEQTSVSEKNSLVLHLSILAIRSACVEESACSLPPASRH